MYLLEWMQGERSQFIGIFDTLESGRAFMRKVPGYRLKTVEEGNFSFEEEMIEYAKLPDIAMIEYNHYRVPLSRFSFEDDIMVVWIELDNLDAELSSEKRESPADAGEEENIRKTTIGATRIDAYSINNEEVEAYVKRREEQFRRALQILEREGFEVSRGCFGSEDGEAIFIRKRREIGGGEERWHFLTHMDPSFVEEDVETEILRLLSE